MSFDFVHFFFNKYCDVTFDYLTILPLPYSNFHRILIYLVVSGRSCVDAMCHLPVKVLGTKGVS